MKRFAAMAAVILACISGAQANVVMDTIPVGNPGNANDTEGAGYGGVAYTYNMGKYEVTAGQYTEFLNAVAQSDTYLLYHVLMWLDDDGCKIQRTGSAGNYSYSVAPDRADHPVRFTNLGDAVRFANWMHNGQPTGAQGIGTTEDGSYFVNGAMSQSELLAITREPDATWVIPSEDEWYKAAYYKGGGADAGYWEYPTQSDAAPAAEAPPGTDMTDGSANYWSTGYLDTTYYTTEVGAYTGKPSNSAYGTFDQGGNVAEWNEASIGSLRGLRGSSFEGGDFQMRASIRGGATPTYHLHRIGFRVAEVSEPAPLSLDIKPGSCPNPLNRNSNGVLPVGLLGTAGFDVTQVDVSSITISRADGTGGSVAPNEGPPGPHAVIEDVGTPLDAATCGCHDLTTDGLDDLMMHFRTQDVVDTLGLDGLNGGDEVELTVSGTMLDGTPFTASDCILIVPPATGNLAVTSNVPGAWIDLAPADNQVDAGGFADFDRGYLVGQTVTLTVQENQVPPGYAFRRWVVDGVLQPWGQRTIQVTVPVDMTARALYREIVVPGGDPRPGPTHESPTATPLGGGF